MWPISQGGCRRRRRVLVERALGRRRLLHAPDARSALVVGLGSGGTARWLADAGLAVDVAEISPRVVEASALFGEGPMPP